MLYPQLVPHAVPAQVWTMAPCALSRGARSCALRRASRTSRPNCVSRCLFDLIRRYSRALLQARRTNEALSCWASAGLRLQRLSSLLLPCGRERNCSGRRAVQITTFSAGGQRRRYCRRQSEFIRRPKRIVQGRLCRHSYRKPDWFLVTLPDECLLAEPPPFTGARRLSKMSRTNVRDGGRQLLAH